MKKKVMALVGLVFMSFALLLAGCAGEGADSAQGSLSDTPGQALADTGTLILKVNPEIAIDYDGNGKVTSVRGINDEGKEIISEYPDYIGKNSREVLEDLIALIGDAGYFVEEVEGDPKKIVIELEAGSPLPNDDFLEKMAVNAQHAVEEYKLNSDVEVDGEIYISLEKAKQVAFEHAKVDGSKARFDDEELDVDEGVPVYELEFEIGKDEYEYDIHALTGEIIDYENDLEFKRETTQPSEPAPKKAEQVEKETILSLEEAKQIALNHAGVDRSQARFDDQELDEEDDVLTYELEFEIGGNEYEYDIHALTGKILDFEQDRDDD